MIFQTNKKNKQSQAEAGVSLMLAVLILAAITAITFSLATIVFVEVRSSGDLLRTEPALYATLGVTEEALFQYKKLVNERDDGSTVNTIDVPGCSPAKNLICDIGGVTLSLPGAQPLDFDITPTTVTILAGETVTIPLYEKDNFDILYDEINLELIPNGVSTSDDLSIRLTQIPRDDSGSVSVVVNDTFSIGDQVDVAGFMNSGFQYDLVLNNSQGSKNFLLNVYSIGSNDSPDPPYGKGVPMGLPFVGKKALRVVANYLGLSRTFTVIIPVP